MVLQLLPPVLAHTCNGNGMQQLSTQQPLLTLSGKGATVTLESKQQSLSEIDIHQQWLTENILNANEKTASNAVMIKQLYPWLLCHYLQVNCSATLLAIFPDKLLVIELTSR